MIEPSDQTIGDLQEHLDVCTSLLALAHRESDALKRPEPFPASRLQEERKVLLTRLDSALSKIIQKRATYRQSRSEESRRDSRLAQLLQTSLDTIMRILVLDRENEQHLLRRGLLPVRSLPPVEQSQPGFVARLYQRHAQC